MAARRVHAKARDMALARRAELLLAAALGMAGPTLAATPPPITITNTASASYTVAGKPVTVTGSATVTGVGSTQATIELMALVGSGRGALQIVAPTACKTSSGFTPMPAPKPAGGAALAVPSSATLADADFYSSGDVIFVKVIDTAQDTDPLTAQSIEVTITTDSGDSETLRLTETGPSTGVFVGYLPSTRGPAQPGDCLLSIGGNDKISATYAYSSQSQQNAVVKATALVDPLGLVFDSATGQPVNGAKVTLIDASSGLPAPVLGLDGVSKYPSTVTTGGTVMDAGGASYQAGPGRFQFPRVAPGSYRFVVEAPGSYQFPSAVQTATLQALPGAPFQIVQGSRGEAFTVPVGPALRIDLPIDAANTSGAANLSLTKSAGKAVAAVGDFVPYTLGIRNSGKSAATQLRIVDHLPLGFRYVPGSARLNGQRWPDPAISADGRELDFLVGTVAGSDDRGSSPNLTYVASVTPGAPSGVAENTAQVKGGGSNVARASVLIRDDLNRERGILFGRVTLAPSCDEAEGDAGRGLKDVRVMLHDGTYVITDSEGRWHADNLRPGRQVVQIDETSLPGDFEVKSCESQIRTGGRKLSQLVDVRAGSLWRADFRFVAVPSCMRQKMAVHGKAVRLELAAPVANQRMTVTVMVPGTRVREGTVRLDDRPFTQAEIGDGFLVLRLARHQARWQHVLAFELESDPSAPPSAAVQVQPNNQPAQQLRQLRLTAGEGSAEQCAPIALPEAGAASAAAPDPAAAPAPQGQRQQLIEKLPYDDKWIAAAPAGVEWLHPQASFQPALPVVKAAVKHGARDTVELKINGHSVDPLQYDGATPNPAGTLAVSSWRSIPLRDGANTLSVMVRDPQGAVLLEESREIRYVVGPAKAVVDMSRSVLAADGRVPPVIAVRMLDKDDQPVRRGATGELEIGSPYLSLNQKEALQADPLTGNLGGKAQYEIGDNGIALIRLQPTTQAGEVVLKFNFGEGQAQEARVWLTPDLREWVLVGFAEGTFAHKQLSGNMSAVNDRALDELDDKNRVAFYAKGRVKGEYLLTVAYDLAAKQPGAGGSTVLKQAIDPTQYYTLYGDATQAQFDAASASKLYVKLEKSQFYALFGDYDTGLTATELGRYSRTLNGAKSEYQGERFGYSVFASSTSQSFHKDEIQGQGISGLYRLSARNIVVNSDKVRIEVRDRLRPEIVVSTQEMVRFVDYEIDPILGTLRFRQPIAGVDANMNPTVIVAEYESDDQTERKLTYGGRVSMKLGESAVVGATHIHEGNVGREATLNAADFQQKFGDKTRLVAEVARSERHAIEGPSGGDAYVLELSHSDKSAGGRVYARQQDIGFGLGQQSGSATGTRKLGTDGYVKLSEATQLQATVYRDERDDSQLQQARRIAESRIQWSNTDVSTYLGGRVGHESDSAGLDHDVRQVIGGASWQLLDKRLTLRLGADLDVSGQTRQLPSGGQSLGGEAYPSRVGLGADYRLTSQTSLVAEYEHAWIKPVKADTATIGLRTQPWQGAELGARLGSEIASDSGRLYSDLGLVQKLQINEQWAADFGVSSVQTLSGTRPLGLSWLGSSTTNSSGSSGSASNAGSASENLLDYKAFHVGAAYKDQAWSGNGRVEWRRSELGSKVNFLLGARRMLDAGRSLSAGLVASLANGQTDTRQIDLKLSYAHRPLDGRWVWLDRLDYLHESQGADGSVLRSRKLVNNFNANWESRRSQASLQYAAKYVLDTVDTSTYDGFTHLLGGEVRREIAPRWDLGLHAGTLRAMKSGTQQYQMGVSTSVLMADNLWVIVGYNARGFLDRDFAGAQYRTKGIFMGLRFKFDQDTFRLNELSAPPFSFKS